MEISRSRVGESCLAATARNESPVFGEFDRSGRALAASPVSSRSSEEDVPIDYSRFAKYRPRSFDSVEDESGEEAELATDSISLELDHADVKISSKKNFVKDEDVCEKVVNVARKRGVVSSIANYLLGGSSKKKPAKCSDNIGNEDL